MRRRRGTHPSINEFFKALHEHNELSSQVQLIRSSISCWLLNSIRCLGQWVGGKLCRGAFHGVSSHPDRVPLLRVDALLYGTNVIDSMRNKLTNNVEEKVGIAATLLDGESNVDCWASVRHEREMFAAVANSGKQILLLSNALSQTSMMVSKPYPYDVIIKTILLGEADVGKTSLQWRCFCNKAFEDCRNYICCIDFAYRDYTVTIDDNKQILRL